MKNLSGAILLLTVTVSSSAYAGLWEDTKEAASSAWETTKEVTSDAASSAWEATKETSSDLKDGAVEKWNEATASESDSGSLSDIKKLGDKETYVKAWEGVKESAKNPEAPDVDENGIPKQ